MQPKFSSEHKIEVALEIVKEGTLSVHVHTILPKADGTYHECLDDPMVWSDLPSETTPTKVMIAGTVFYDNTSKFRTAASP